MFKNKVIMITGGISSFGNTVENRFLESEIKEIRIFLIDEKKQDDMCRLYYNNKHKFHEEAAELIVFAFENDNSGDLLV